MPATNLENGSSTETRTVTSNGQNDMAHGIGFAKLIDLCSGQDFSVAAALASLVCLVFDLLQSEPL